MDMSGADQFEDDVSDNPPTLSTQFSLWCSVTQILEVLSVLGCIERMRPAKRWPVVESLSIATTSRLRTSREGKERKKGTTVIAFDHAHI